MASYRKKNKFELEQKREAEKCFESAGARFGGSVSQRH